MKPRGRTAKMQLFGNGEKRAEVSQFHPGMISRLPAGRAWGVAVHESFESVVAYVVEAAVQDGRPVLHRVTAGVHCNLVVNPRTVEAQVQGAAVMACRCACLARRSR